MKYQDHQLLEEAYDTVLSKENVLGMGFQSLTDKPKNIIHNRVRDYISDEEADKSIGSPKHIDKEKMAPPANWDKGFEPPYQIGAGGKETPYIKDGKWNIRVWNSQDKKHYIYSYKDDMFYPEGEI